MAKNQLVNLATSQPFLNQIHTDSRGSTATNKLINIINCLWFRCVWCRWWKAIPRSNNDFAEPCLQKKHSWLMESEFMIVYDSLWRLLGGCYATICVLSSLIQCIKKWVTISIQFLWDFTHFDRQSAISFFQRGDVCYGILSFHRRWWTQNTQPLRGNEADLQSCWHGPVWGPSGAIPKTHQKSSKHIKACKIHGGWR